MSRKTSSGFISAPSTLIDNEASVQLNPQSSASGASSRLSISSSFKSFVENHTRPFTRDYNEFATSYLCEHVPFDQILCDDSESVENVECKISSPVPIQKYFIQEKSRREFGPSVRQKYIIPSSQIIWNDIRAYNSRIYQLQKMKQMEKKTVGDKKADVKSGDEIQRSQERRDYLLFKARQWCEVSKALAMDHQFPKPDPNVVRKKYSETHQKAIKMARKDCGVLGKDPIFQPELAAPFTKRFIFYFLRELQRERKRKEKKGDGKRKTKKEDKVDVDTGKSKIKSSEKSKDFFVSYAVGENPDDESSKNKWNEWADTLKTIFNDVTPLEELQSMEPHWQNLAENTGDASMQQRKKRYFKRNVYPPMTMEDYITEKRKLLPPIKPEYLQTDYLSGIWEPELMIESFTVTPLNYDSRLLQAEEAEEAKTDWYVSHEAKKKCWQWLRSIPDNL